MLHINNLTVQFKGTHQNMMTVLDDFTLHIPQQKSLFLIGETGSGKSILLLAILGLLPHSAIVSGEVWCNDKNLLTCSEQERCHIRGKDISYIPQGSGSALNPIMKIGKQVGERLVDQSICSKSEAMIRTTAQLEKLDFDDGKKWANTYQHQLSGGMKQRVLIASGTIVPTKFIVADEPTKGLDGDRVDEVIDIFADMADTTLICVSHDLHFTRKLADNIVVMYAAQMVEYSEKKLFFNNPLHPYSKLMISSLVENGMHYDGGFAPPHTAYDNQGCRFRARCPHAHEKCVKMPTLIDYDGRKVRCWLYDKT